LFKTSQSYILAPVLGGVLHCATGWHLITDYAPLIALAESAHRITHKDFAVLARRATIFHWGIRMIAKERLLAEVTRLAAFEAARNEMDEDETEDISSTARDIIEDIFSALLWDKVVGGIVRSGPIASL
jgi:hypothetical protein